MTGSNQNEVFLVTTQSNYWERTARDRQISTARSRAASLRYSRSRVQSTTAVTVQKHGQAGDFVGMAHSVETRPCRTKIPRLHSWSSCNNSRAEPAASYKDGDEELSLHDLIEIFPNTSLSDKSVLNGFNLSTSTVDDESASSQTYSHSHHSLHASGRAPDSQRKMLTHYTSSESASSVGPICDDAGSAPQPHGVDAYLMVPAICQISSTLDPFIRLPLEITEQEKSLIHFHYNFGRRWLWGTSQNPRHDPVYDLARALIQTSSVIVLTKVILAGSILSRITQRDPQPQYYMRRSQIYKMVNSLLSDDEASFHEKIIAIMALAIVEYASGRSDLQALHIKALDDLIESKGGVNLFRSRIKNVGLLYVSARFYASQFIRTEVRISTMQQLRAVKRRFIHSLSRIHLWHLSFMSQLPPKNTLDEWRDKLRQLTQYLYHLMEASLFKSGTPKSFDKTSGAHFCAFSLVMTLVEYEQSPTLTVDFLDRVQQCLLNSTEISPQAGKELYNLHPFAAAHMFSATRSEAFGDDNGVKEIKICRAIVDAQKMFVVLSEVRRIEIVTYLVGSILTLTNTIATGHEDAAMPFSRKRLQLLEQEIVSAWWAQENQGQE